MALAANLALTTLFGTGATITGTGATAKVNILISDLSADIDIVTAGSPETTITAEGILLGILQKAYAVQGNDAARVAQLDRSAAAITTRGTVPCRKETYTVSIYSDSNIGTLDPDLV